MHLYEGINGTQQNLLNLLNSKTKDVFGIDDSDIMIYNCDHNQNYYVSCDDVIDSIK